MQPIYPLHEDTIKQYCGMPVCVVTNEGERHVGILSRCHGGRIMLNETEASMQQKTTGTTVGQLGKVTNTKVKKKKGGKPSKPAVEGKSQTKEAAQTQAYYPYDSNYYGDPYYGYGNNSFFGEALAFDLASLAFLFLLI
ncbi:hypothetical protein [Paenibacillus sp. OV219]|uniref:hypothetical protein n=1 Tax=Paenibacillus sp. OV219 TaxID=1884377 RepID=UPI0008AB2E54|nr:hypothetical protein [Paenibacillus sp. OV219]SEO90325.1 hypothetical protein SAMN05518847_112116 [Paenibacillus sp. OV219]